MSQQSKQSTPGQSTGVTPLAHDRPTSGHRVTLDDIALAAGTSIATVSRALGDLRASPPQRANASKRWPRSSATGLTSRRRSSLRRGRRSSASSVPSARNCMFATVLRPSDTLRIGGFGSLWSQSTRRVTLTEPGSLFCSCALKRSLLLTRPVFRRAFRILRLSSLVSARLVGTSILSRAPTNVVWGKRLLFSPNVAADALHSLKGLPDPPHERAKRLLRRRAALMRSMR